MDILFITSTRIGDAVLSIGLLHHLIYHYQRAQVTIICGAHAAPLFTAVPTLQQICVLTKAHFSYHLVLLWSKYVWKRWDVVIDLRRSLLSWLLITNKRYVLGKSKTVHRVQKIAHTLGLYDLPMPHYLWTLTYHQVSAKRLLPAGSTIGIGPTSNWHAKSWTSRNFTSLTKKLANVQTGIAPGAHIVIFGAVSERDQITLEMQPSAINLYINLVGKIDLLTTHACLQRCVLYIGNDSGLLHLAATSNVLTLGLFGPSADPCYVPWCWRSAITQIVVLPSRIYPWGFDHRTTNTLMTFLAVNKVEFKARDLWKKYNKHLLLLRQY